MQQMDIRLDLAVGKYSTEENLNEKKDTSALAKNIL